MDEWWLDVRAADPLTAEGVLLNPRKLLPSCAGILLLPARIMPVLVNGNLL